MLLIWLAIVIGFSFALGGPVLFVLFSLLALVRSMMLRFIRIQRGEIPPAKADLQAEDERIR